jgi:hypothetical protein
MLDFSQIEAGQPGAHLVAVDLAQRTREILALFQCESLDSGLTRARQPGGYAGCCS